MTTSGDHAYNCGANAAIVGECSCSLSTPTPGDLSARLPGYLVKALSAMEKHHARAVIEYIAALSALPAGGECQKCGDTGITQNVDGRNVFCICPTGVRTASISTTPQPSAAEGSGFPKCGCGRPGEYESENGPACNKYFRCKDAAVGAQGDGDAVEHAVDRFLAWPLPKDFGPDCGISFTPLGHPNGWPSGTNLLTAAQAKAMFQHCLTAPAAGKGVDDAMVERACRAFYGGRWDRVEMESPRRWMRAALEAALTRQPVAGDGVALSGYVNGFLHRTRAIEIKADAPLPKWLTNTPDLRITLVPAATPTDGGEGKS